MVGYGWLWFCRDGVLQVVESVQFFLIFLEVIQLLILQLLFIQLLILLSVAREMHISVFMLIVPVKLSQQVKGL